MTCKVDHSDPDAIPQILCRECNPMVRLIRDDTLARAAEVVRDRIPSLSRKLVAEQLVLDNMVATYGNAAKTAIEKQRAKVARLAKRVEEIK